MKTSTTWALLLLGIYVAMGCTNDANSQSLQFSFSNCNDIVTEAKLTEILEHKTQYGTNDADTDAFKRNSQPTELDKPLKVNTEAKFGSATCSFSGPSRGGKGVFASMPIYTGTIEVSTTNTQSKFAAFSSKNTANLQRFHQTVIEETTEIGKATVVNKMEIGRLSKSFSVKFLDDEIDAFVDVSIQETNSMLGRSKTDENQGAMKNVLQKIKSIAKEAEKNIK